MIIGLIFLFIFVGLFLLLIVLKVTGVIHPISERKGKIGELKINNKIQHLLGEDDVMLNNLLIPMKNGHKTEIDTVVISSKGIYCIEIKNWKGYINGDDYIDYWIQTKYYEYQKTQTKHYNPVKQNETHTNSLKRILNNKFDVYNIVILTGFDKNYVNSIYTYDMASFKNYYEYKDEILTNDEIKEIALKLRNYIATKEQLRLHAEEIKNRYGEN